MKALKHEDIKELTSKVCDLIAKTSVEIGHRIDANSLALLSKTFAYDLKTEIRFGNLTFNQIQEAFRQGVRFSEEEPFLNIRTFAKWVVTHKKIIDHATYQVETLKMPKDKIPFFQEQIKLLK